MATMTQVGTIISLMQGVYDGDIPFREIAQYGDTGLGTVDKVDGEMIALDGEFYRVDSEGVAHRIAPDVGSPFAVVAPFAADLVITVGSLSNVAALSDVLDQHLPHKNQFYLIRIDGQFGQMRMRSESCQLAPYRPLAETMPEVQKEFYLEKTTGTLVATFSPSYAAAINVRGYHFHYIDQARSTGGHVFDCVVEQATVAIQGCDTLTMRLFKSEAFKTVDLDVDPQVAIHQVEKRLE